METPLLTNLSGQNVCCENLISEYVRCVTAGAPDWITYGKKKCHDCTSTASDKCFTATFDPVTITGSSSSNWRWVLRRLGGKKRVPYPKMLIHSSLTMSHRWNHTNQLGKQRDRKQKQVLSRYRGYMCLRGKDTPKCCESQAFDCCVKILGDSTHHVTGGVEYLWFISKLKLQILADFTWQSDYEARQCWSLNKGPLKRWFLGSVLTKASDWLNSFFQPFMAYMQLWSS